MIFKTFLVICFTLIFTFVKADPDSVVVCYYGTWATYRHGNGKFDTSNTNPSLCTHLIYTFIGLNSEGSVISLDPYLDYQENYGRDNFNKFNDLKSKNSQLKTLLAVGGYNEGSARFSTMAANPYLRKNFITSAKEMVLKYKFDGLDIDWEYPAQRDTTNGAADKENFSTLVKELKEEFATNNLLVTIAVAAVFKSASLSYDIATVSQYVDYIHLMCYDLHGSWDGVTGHNAGLHKSESELNLPFEQEFTVEASVKYWLQEGAPPEKLVVGVPAYGRTFTLSSENAGVGAPISGPGSPGPYTQQGGFLGYNEICEKRQSEAWDIHQDDLAKVPYAVYQNTWISFDDPTSLEAKVNFVLENKLAGVMVWSIETDDLHRLCGGEDFPLLRTLNRALGKLDGQTSNEGSTTNSVSTSTTEAVLTSTTAPSSTSASATPSLSTSTDSTPVLTTTTTDLTTSTTSLPSTSTNPSSICKTEGYAPNPKDCSSFYICLRSVDGSLTPLLYRCPENLRWDQKILSCNYADQVSCSN